MGCGGDVRRPDRQLLLSLLYPDWWRVAADCMLPAGGGSHLWQPGNLQHQQQLTRATVASHVRREESVQLGPSVCLLTQLAQWRGVKVSASIWQPVVQPILRFCSRFKHCKLVPDVKEVVPAWR